MQVADSFVVDAPLERVWSMITDPEVVGPCIPGCQGIEVTGPATYKADIRVAVGPIKTTFSVTVEKTEERPPHFASSTTKGEEGGRASTLNATSTLTLSEIEGGTEIAYASDVSVFGRLGKFGLGVMKKKARDIGHAFADNFREKAEGNAS
ncbi:MAG: carbon monoxide dehydrogenase subunit G [Defluviicoccus sp.]|nr:carbon monoxide dehydrogenase subunit G [Defluviicoccus sp.]